MSIQCLTREDVRAEVSPAFYERGAKYLRAGRVLVSEHSRGLGPDIVTGRVLGSHDHVYDVRIDIDPGPRRATLQGECTCPVGFNCKHVVAVLLDQISRRESGRGSKAATRAKRSNDDLLRNWASRLATVGREAGDTSSEQSRDRLLFILKLQANGEAKGLASVEPVRCRVSMQGRYGEARPFETWRALEPGTHGLADVDVEILRLLGPPAGGSPAFELSGTIGAHVLQAIAATGRCHWQDKDGPVLAQGAPRPALPVWVADDEGRQWLRFETRPAAPAILPLSPPWYADPDAGLCGELDTGLSPVVAAAVADAPPVDPLQAGNLPPALAASLVDLGLPTPRVLDIEGVNAPPSPRLRLVRSEAGGESGDRSRRAMYARARLSFDYDGVELPCDPAADAAVAVRRRADRLVRVHRSLAEEDAFLQVLEDRGLWPLPGRFAAAGTGERPFELAFAEFPDDEVDARAWVSFLDEDVPRLRREGWRVDVDGDFDHQLALPEAWYADADPDAGRSGWFDLDLGVIVDGEPLSLLTVLHEYLSQAGVPAVPPEDGGEEDRMAVRAPDGRWLVLPGARVRAIVSTLLELTDPELRLDKGRLRLASARAAEVETITATETSRAPPWRGTERLRKLTTGLNAFRGVAPLSPPPEFRAELRPYQRFGLGWLQFLREYGLGGILADDMGLGKTVQTLAHLSIELRAGRLDRPSLVVAPTSLVTNWALEAGRFAPGLDLLVLHGPGRKVHFPAIPDYHLVITTYALATRDREVLAAQPWHLLVLDEAQAIKNPRAKVSQALRSFEARARLCLTGTPLENHLGELWSLFEFLEPGLLGEQRQFRRLFRTPIERHGDAGRQATLQRRVAPFILRRTKGEVLPELPDKTEIEHKVELLPAQRDLYETIRVAMDRKVRGALAERGLARSQILVLDALLKLRQVCCDPRLVKLDAARAVRGSAKLDLLMSLLPEMVEEGQRVLVFSQFTTMLGLIEEAIRAEGIDYVMLTGKTRDRATPVRRFQAGEIPVFLISLKAGGTGLNLTAADTVIHYDPWWNPAVEDQASDRAHRIGQDKKVFVYRLVTAGTVEEKIITLQARKKKLAASVFAEGVAGGGGQFNDEDLADLFQPLA